MTTAQLAEAPALASTSTTSAYLYSDAPTRAGYPNRWTLLTNAGYESAYDETFRNPAWVAYHLHGTAGTSAPRQNGYTTDLRTVAKVAQTDYPHGYDHGHMAPNEAIAEFYGDAAQAETFLMTNMLPQRHGLNAGPWKSEETMEYAKWEPEFHDVWVIDGPVYTTADGQALVPTDRYGAKQVGIPVACFKIVMTKRSGGQIQTLAFIMPQEPGPGHAAREYLTSIREIERRTGLNFFSSLPKAKQDALETGTARAVWP
ncbi:MAG: DNA/RNA non-specific endonuclease [Opitutaceae bacterium]